MIMAEYHLGRVEHFQMLCFQFLGTWYEIKWIIPIYRKDITPLADYTETYKKGTGENITITAQARSVNTAIYYIILFLVQL